MNTNAQIWKIVDRIESFSPDLSRWVVGTFLRLSSPFNAPLRAKLEVWESTRCRIRVGDRRALHNHLGGVHAAALVTAGETPAGLVILKNFPFDRYRLILKNLSTEYERQARTDIVAEATVSEATLAQAKQAVEAGEPYFIAIETVISDPEGTRLAVVRTNWQVKAWEQVRSNKAAAA